MCIFKVMNIHKTGNSFCCSFFLSNAATDKMGSNVYNSENFNVNTSFIFKLSVFEFILTKYNPSGHGHESRLKIQQVVFFHICQTLSHNSWKRKQHLWHMFCENVVLLHVWHNNSSNRNLTYWDTSQQNFNIRTHTRIQN